MTDSKEESIDSNIIFLFVLFAFEAYKMRPFNTVLTIESKGISIVEDLNIVLFCNALTHDLRCTKVRFANDHIDLLCQTRQIHCLFTSCITTANYGYYTLTIEESVACGTCTYTLTTVLFFIRKTKILRTGTCCNDQSVGFYHVTTLILNMKRTLAKVGFNDRSVSNISPVSLRLLAHFHHQLVCVNAFMEPREVLNDSCCSQLTAWLHSRI